MTDANIHRAIFVHDTNYPDPAMYFQHGKSGEYADRSPMSEDVKLDATVRIRDRIWSELTKTIQTISEEHPQMDVYHFLSQRTGISQSKLEKSLQWSGSLSLATAGLICEALDLDPDFITRPSRSLAMTAGGILHVEHGMSAVIDNVHFAGNMSPPPSVPYIVAGRRTMTVRNVVIAPKGVFYLVDRRRPIRHILMKLFPNIHIFKQWYYR